MQKCKKVKKMPYLITFSWFPLNKAQEVANKYVEVMQKFPPDDTLGTDVVPIASTSNEKGIETIGITEIKEGKLQEAMTRAVNIAVLFYNIEGFNYKIRVYNTVTEGMTALGINNS